MLFRSHANGKSSGGKAGGDLLVTIDVQVPTALNDEQRDAVEALTKVLDEYPRASMFADGDAGAGAAGDSDSGEGATDGS